MDLIAAVRGYLDRIVSETSGMKALLMDSYTTSVTSLIYSQTEILGKEGAAFFISPILLLTPLRAAGRTIR